MNPMPASPRLLVVDDEPDLRTLYELTLLRLGYQVEAAANLAEARDWLAQQTFDIVITDMRLPDGLGLELVKELAQAQRPEKCMVVTAYGSPEKAVEALKAGAFDYLTKPVDLQQFRTAVATALHDVSRSSPSSAPPRAPTGHPTPTAPAPGAAASLACIVGPSAVMVAVRQRLEKVARSMAPVLVLGESGTGKELVAQALHACSHRADGPFVAVNCGAIPENLIEAEFFGVRKGAYTGATHDRPGYFQAARGGTLFLDEIGDLPVPMQAKLLRAIQERKVRPLGSTQEEPVDVRFVSATHRDLAQAVRTQQFRQDLFYRLNVIELRIPPLRERREDLPELAQTLLLRLCRETGQALPRLDASTLAWLQQQPLPGNVRELENLLHRGLALCNGDTLTPDDMAEEPHSGLGGLSAASAPSPAPAPTLPVAEPPPPAPPPTPTATLVDYLDRREREVLLHALEQHGGEAEAAATALQLNPRQLRFRLQRLGLEHHLRTPDRDG
ncbi:sigma-54-dependent transcriptional regulator [Macromonas nakdongensis]|uniref:sigma-54-dependent transcriptional regulator n=1 Tax=Macromonas nakdongensis TaxID=1843082 RepID=UPI000C3408ED|nr:sigma-54 dependent transcriptional regulator [Macromonas nakdongensis]